VYAFGPEIAWEAGRAWAAHLGHADLRMTARYAPYGEHGQAKYLVDLLNVDASENAISSALLADGVDQPGHPNLLRQLGVVCCDCISAHG